jgi:DNA-directed RNA polymerase specialized sigma24 family protein
MMVADASREKWSLTREAFDGLLASIGPDRDTAGERYLEIRRNLVRLFEWRGAATPEDHADETINRCARKIAEGEQIRDLASYAIGVARMLFREKARESARESWSLEDIREPQVAPPQVAENQEDRVECLRTCLGQITPVNRELILSYYHGEKGEKIKIRKGLTSSLGIPPSTLRMRALRVRETLQMCVETCLHRAQAGNAW